MADALEKRGLDSIVSQTGCMGYCYAEPTIEVTLPGSDPVVFGGVDQEKADEIIEKYIKGRELVDRIKAIKEEQYVKIQHAYACLRCLGACGLTPVVQVGDKTYGRVSTDDVERIISKYMV